MDGDAPAAPEPPLKRDASGPARPGRDAPRRKAKTLPPPPPGSAARKALDKIVDLDDAEDAEPPALPRAPVLPAGRPPPVPARARPPAAGVPRAPRAGEPTPIDLSSLPEADRTKENRGAVGIKHDKNASLTANAASGTIGGDTPVPIFDRAAIAAGPSAPITGGPAGSSDAVPQRAVDRSPSGAVSPSGSGPNAARGTPKPGALSTPSPGALVDRIAPSPDAVEPERPAPSAPAPASAAPPSAATGDDGAPGTPSDPRSRLAVPVGEFDHGETVLEKDKLRIAHAQATIKRDAANALLGLPEPAPAARPSPAEILLGDTVPRARGAALNDASAASTGRWERGDPTRADPTLGDRGDATALTAPAVGHAPTGTLRTSASLPRERGIAGDVRYVATVALGLRRTRRELAEIAARQATRQQSRRHHLVTLGRAAATADGFDHPALADARDQLASVEDERGQHAGHVIAADAELVRVRRERDAKAQQHGADLAGLDSELAQLAKTLEPLEKEVAGIKRRGADLQESLRRIDAKMAATEASLTQVKGGKLDRAEVQAELATLRADRKAIQSDEPVIAGRLDALSPRIAQLEAARAEAQRKRAESAAAEHDDQRRVEELLAAIGAKRKVVDRAAADAEARRDKILFQLGERLYVDRPDDLTAELAPIDEIDLELGSADRRMMELREILASVDRWKLARGIAVIALVLAAIAAVAGWRLGLWP
ncbi:MAG: hypothetical protein E6J90_51235 [Deltaproteobacteria bacterium]|nr:MAG: hypothetical protein E6J90_51235 [Deltaproteobacteria bacterium]TMQ10340.1 MAG: hypothetical protein E6J91_26955 [Deltaproteobacteria bacterium]